MSTCYELVIGGQATITLAQFADLSFRVTYGLEKSDRLPYDDAAHRLGACIMHALANENLLDNSDIP